MSEGITLSPSDLEKLYAARHYLGGRLRKKFGLTIPFHVYFQDPWVAEEHPDFGIDKKCYVNWEPGIADGPTSSRFAVVDYNGDTGTLAPPATWDAESRQFKHGDALLNEENREPLQFHQVNVWAILQRALDFFERPEGLGRRIPWGFDGDRLIVVPHAGYGENAYYDRESKSLQFYYFEKEDGGLVQTCLSTDVVHHEFGHAVLDGVRPHLNESVSIETAAMHEAVGDITAVLITLRNNEFRRRLVRETQGDLSEADRLAGIADEFGKAIDEDRPYLRSALNQETMETLRGSLSAHDLSQVLTGAVFDILLRLSEQYLERRPYAGKAFWNTIQRVHRMVVQPLDFLPPVDVTFRDYALAMLRAEAIANPRDPYRYRETMAEVFVARKILTPEEMEEQLAPDYVHNRLDLDIFHPVDRIGASEANAYRFLDDNRASLGLPAGRDIVVTDLYHADKYARQARRLPRQLTLEYLWREDVQLVGARFGEFADTWMEMPCGGTIVFDEHNNVLWWTSKDDTEDRRKEFLDNVERLVANGMIGPALDGSHGILGTRVAPFRSHAVGDRLRVELAPHLSAKDHHVRKGGRQWQVSS